VRRLLGPLTALIVFAVAVTRGHTALAVFAAVLALAMLVSELWAWLCFQGLTYRRSLERERVTAGEQVTLQLEFVNAKPLPLAWLLARDRLPRGLALVGADGEDTTTEWLNSLVSLRWYERVVRRVPLRCPTRGTFDLGPTQLVTGDVFGYRRVLRVEPDTTRLVVYPRVWSVAQLAVAAGIPQGEASFWRRLGPDPLRFSQLRDYRPGDSPRHIHWRASARSGSLQTREFEPSASTTTIVALDVQTMEHAYEHIPARLEHAISAAASLAIAALEARWQTGLLVNGPSPDGAPWQYVEPSQHPQQAAEILAALAGLTPYRGDRFEAMLGALQPRLPAGASLVCVSAWVRASLLQTLLALRHAQHPVCLYAIGDAPLEPVEGLEIIHLGGGDAWERLQTLALV
jgi:uncharacterized protein (DUF58 family)